MVLAKEKIVAAIGVSDEDVAHLRLLMRKAAKSLSYSWRWGNESSADLFVIDPQDFAGQMARTRAQATGMRVALVCEAGAEISADGDLLLYRPFKEANIVEVLNAATDASASLASVVPSRHNFYYSDEADASGSELGESAAPIAREFGAGAAIGLDEMIRGNPLVDPFAGLKGPKLDASVSVEAADGPTRRSDARAPSESAARAPETLTAASSSPTSQKRGAVEDRSAHRLRDYLVGDLLRGPSQIAWPDAGVLVLDPKNQVFHSDSGLKQLEIYCRESPRRSDWHALTSADMNVLRETQPAQPYSKLVWLDVLLHSGGKLATHLDPGGTYRLKHWLEIRRDYPRQSRIAAVMMQPLRLHEIAAAATGEMSDVFDLVNAYDAIGLLEWSKRAPRHEEPKNEGAISGWMQRLRKPFGKN